MNLDRRRRGPAVLRLLWSHDHHPAMAPLTHRGAEARIVREPDLVDRRPAGLDIQMDVLRQIATPRARQLLAKLAEGPENTQEEKNRKLMARYTLDDIEKLKLRRGE